MRCWKTASLRSQFHTFDNTEARSGQKSSNFKNDYKNNSSSLFYAATSHAIMFIRVLQGLTNWTIVSLVRHRFPPRPHSNLVVVEGVQSGDLDLAVLPSLPPSSTVLVRWSLDKVHINPRPVKTSFAGTSTHNTCCVYAVCWAGDAAISSCIEVSRASTRDLGVKHCASTSRR